MTHSPRTGGVNIYLHEDSIDHEPTVRMVALITTRKARSGRRSGVARWLPALCWRGPVPFSSSLA